MRRRLTSLCAAMAAGTAGAAVPGGTMTDQTGRTVRIPPKVERVASLVIPGASMQITLDRAPDRLVGMHPSARQDMGNGLLERFFPALRDVPANLAGEGFAPNVEALVRTRPDIVIQWGDRHAGIVRPMERAGLNVLTLRYGKTDYVTTWLRMMGTATGRAARGERLARWIETERDTMRHALRDLPAGQRPRVLFLTRYHGGLQVAGQGMNFGDDIGLAGGINVAGGTVGSAPVSREQIAAWAPDVILLGNADPRMVPDDIRRDPLLAATPAVRRGRVYKSPRGGFRWDPPSQETPLNWRWLGALLHPERFTAQDLRQRMPATFLDLYGKTISEADIDAILRMDLNGRSAGYQRFARQP